MNEVCPLCGFDTGALLIGVAVGLALGIAAAIIRRRALDQEGLPFENPYQRALTQCENEISRHD